MTETELRNLVVSTAKKYYGCKESNGSHKQIIDIYNAHKPLARGYAVKYTDAWCATFVSTVAILCDITDILPTECGCGKQIDLFKRLGSWVEKDSYTPKPGDVIYYDWDDSGSGDNTGSADHVGIVTACDGSTITIIEGNMSDAVGYRSIKVNARYIRGFGVPNYASKATPAKTETVKEEPEVAKMTQAEFNRMFKTAMEQYRAELQDNDCGDWSAEGRQYMIDSGLMVGSGTVNGQPNYMWGDFLTREQLAVVMQRFAKLVGQA